MYTNILLFHFLNQFDLYILWNLKLYMYMYVCIYDDVRGGPFDTWGGLWFFLRDQTFFFDSQLKRTIFFRPYQKQTIFFLGGKTRNNFFHNLFHLILRTPC